MDYDKLPIYDLQFPFDSIKTIIATIMGEPRLSYEMIKDAGELNTLINACWIDPETLTHSPLFQVKTDALQFITKEDNEFGDIIHEQVKTFNTLGEYSHLLYTFGKTALNFIAAILIEINSKGERKPVSVDFSTLYYQLHNALETSWNDLSFLFGTKKSNEDIFDYETNKLLVDFRNIYNFTIGLYEDIKEKDHWCEFGEILAALYGSLASLLIGLTIKLTNNSIVDPAKLFNTDEDISKSTINTFANAFMSNETIDATTKNRYISLLIFFYKLNEFYRIYNGIQIDDPMIIPIVSLGEEFASLPEEQLVENIDLSILNQGDLEIHTSKTFESFLSYENFISSPASYYINCLDYDTANKVIVARAITFLFKYNSIDIDESLKTKYKPAYYSLIEESGENITDEGKILGLYDFFINNVVGKVLKNTCDVKLYHLVTMCAIHFKYLTKQSLSKELTEYVYGGLYQAEALMVFLWHDWFQSGKTYKVEKNIHCADNKALGLLYKAKQYVKIDLIHYLQAAFEIQSPSFYTEDKSKYDYTRDFYQTISIYHMSLLANKYNYNLNTIYQIGDMGKTTITEGSNEFFVNTGLDNILPHIYDKNYNASIEDKAESDYEDYYQNDIPLIYLYSKYGIENITFGLLWVNTVLQKEFPEETLQTLNDLNFEDNIKPWIADNVISAKIAQNLSKIIKGKFGTNDRFNKYFSILLRAIVQLGFAREAMYHTIDSAEYLENQNKNMTKTLSELDYETVIPFLESQHTFTFLNRR